MRALWLSASLGHAGVIQALLTAGANIEAKDNVSDYKCHSL